MPKVRERCEVCKKLFNINKANWISMRVRIRLLVWKPKLCSVDCALKELRRLKQNLRMGQLIQQ